MLGKNDHSQKLSWMHGLYLLFQMYSCCLNIAHRHVVSISSVNFALKYGHKYKSLYKCEPEGWGEISHFVISTTTLIWFQIKNFCSETKLILCQTLFWTEIFFFWTRQVLFKENSRFKAKTVWVIFRFLHL